MLTTRIPSINFKVLAGAVITGTLALTIGTNVHAASITPQQIVDDGATGIQMQYNDGATITDNNAGASDDNGSPIQTQSHFRAGSVSKTVVSVALLQLVEQGKVSLDEPIETYLPGAYTFGKEVTVRQILGQTSGLATSAYESQFPYDPDTILTRKGTEEFINTHYNKHEITKFINTAGLSETPGAKWQYSNANFFIASQLITSVAKKPYDVYIDKNVFKPLGMKDSSFPSARPTLPKPYVRGYQPSEFYSGQPGGESIELTRQSPSMFEGSGNLVTTTGDLNRFFQALASDSVLNAQTLTIMQTSNVENPLSYGLGLMQFESPCGVIRGHSGNVYGYSTEAYYLGNKSIAISVNEGTGIYASHSAKSMQLAFETLCPEAENTSSQLRSLNGDIQNQTIAPAPKSPLELTQ